MLDRVQLRWIAGALATPVVAMLTGWFGGNAIQMMLAPVGGAALGMAVAYGVLHSKKLPLTATWGEFKLVGKTTS